MVEMVELNEYLPSDLGLKVRSISLLRQMLQISNGFLKKENLDKVLKVVKTEEFKYYSSFITPVNNGSWKELETKKGVVLYDLVTSNQNDKLVNLQDGEYFIQFAKDEFVDINFKVRISNGLLDIDMNKLDYMLEFAFNNNMRIQNFEFWHDVVVSNLDKCYFNDKSFCAVGLTPKSGVYFEDFLNFASLNGFKDEAILYLCERGNLFSFLDFLTSEDKVKFREQIKSALIRKLLRLDFSELIYFLHSYKDSLVDFKDDIKAYLKWILDVNPRAFKAKLYSFKNNSWKVGISIFFPDELSGYFAKLIISSN